MRTVVIGASSGLGRCVAVALAQQGEPVAMLARRKDRLDEAAAEGGPTAVPIEWAPGLPVGGDARPGGIRRRASWRSTSLPDALFGPVIPG